MKVFQDGKEVKNAKVSYFAGGQPAHVEVEGVKFDPAAFEFRDDEPAKKTKDGDAEVMTTKNTPAKKK
jgi:hypothetical protein